MCDFKRDGYLIAWLLFGGVEASGTGYHCRTGSEDRQGLAFTIIIPRVFSTVIWNGCSSSVLIEN
jgi:hypothetical protein